MIGFFDSGFWWLKTMKYFHNLYPDYDYIFLADNKNCPFGEKSWKEIEEITFNALNWLFDHWAKIVIVACNTAAAYSIRKRQSLYPDKKTLSITIPWIEEIIDQKKKWWSIGIIATQATVMSDIYNDLYARFWWKWNPDFHFIMAPKLVDMVESWSQDKPAIILTIDDYISRLPKTASTLILGCTHFSVYKQYFKNIFKWKIIDPSYYSAKKFKKYLKNHPEVEQELQKKSTLQFYTTWDTNSFNTIWSNIWWEDIKSEHVDI